MKEPDSEKSLSRRTLTPGETLDHCYHEAGHAVAAIRLGLGLSEKVEVIPEGEGWRERGMQAIWFGRTSTERSGSADEKAVFLLAGIAAERRHSPQAQTTGHWIGDQNAHFQLFPDGNHHVKHWIETQQLLDRNWRAVEAVALALLHAEHFYLAPDDVVSVVNKYPPAPEHER